MPYVFMPSAPYPNKRENVNDPHSVANIGWSYLLTFLAEQNRYKTNINTSRAFHGRTKQI